MRTHCLSVICHHDLFAYPLGHVDIRKSDAMINLCGHRIVTLLSFKFVFRGHFMILHSYNQFSGGRVCFPAGVIHL